MCRKEHGVWTGVRDDYGLTVAVFFIHRPPSHPPGTREGSSTLLYALPQFALRRFMTSAQLTFRAKVMVVGNAHRFIPAQIFGAILLRVGRAVRKRLAHLLDIRSIVSIQALPQARFVHAVLSRIPPPGVPLGSSDLLGGGYHMESMCTDVHVMCTPTTRSTTAFQLASL